MIFSCPPAKIKFMNTRFFVAVITAAVISFFGGWLVFGILFMDYYSSNMNEESKVLIKEMPAMGAVAVANLAWAWLITWVLDRTGNTGWRRGFGISLWVSFLVMVLFDLSLYSFWDIYPLGFIITDIIAGSLFWGVVGGIAGAILSSERLEKKAMAT